MKFIRFEIGMQKYVSIGVKRYNVVKWNEYLIALSSKLVVEEKNSDFAFLSGEDGRCI